MISGRHQYIERKSGNAVTEQLVADEMIRRLYSNVRENSLSLFNLLTGARMSSLLGMLNYDAVPGRMEGWCRRFVRLNGIDLGECVDGREVLKSMRALFERKIRWWECRPMRDDPHEVVSPADARVVVGSLDETSVLFLKEKFFGYEELLGERGRHWGDVFRGGDFAVFRLTPDKYHYNHTPVAGVVADIYEVPGSYHSCNPSAVLCVATPYSKNKRVVTVIDTDVPGGTGVGLVAMVEVVALMIGEIVQRYSETRYDSPVDVRPGMFLVKGVPKSLYRPGSSTDVLLFQKGRISFAPDILDNLCAPGVESRFSAGFGAPLVETDLAVRSPVAFRSDCRQRQG